MDGLNRILLAVLGAVMLAVGVLGTLTVLDVLDAGAINDAIPYRDVWDGWTRIDWQVAWVRWVLMGAAILLALLALVLLLREVTVRRGHGDRRVLATAERGRTVLSTEALRAAAAREAEGMAGVERARVERLVVDGTAPPSARYRVRADADAHLPTLGTQVAERAAASLARVLGTEPGEVTVVMEIRHDRRAEHDNRRVQ